MILGKNRILLFLKSQLSTHSLIIGVGESREQVIKHNYIMNLDCLD